MQRPRGLGGMSLISGALGSNAISPDQADGEATPHQTRFGRFVRGLVVGVAALLLLAAGGLMLAQHRFADHVYPSISAGTVDIGGMSVTDARGAIQANAQRQEAQTVTLRYQGKTWTPTYADLGISIDIDKTLDSAYSVGREDTARARLTSLAGLMHANHAVPLIVMVDQSKLNAWFDKVDGDLGIRPHDAYLVIDGAKVEIEPEVQGVVVDRVRMTRIVTAGAQTLSIANTDLAVSATIPSVRAGDLTALQAQVQTALSKGIKLKYPGKRWTLKPEEISPFLVQATDPSKQGAAAVSVTVDEKALSSWLNDQFSGDINKDPVNAQIAWSDDAQNVYALTPSEDGAKLKPLTFARAIISSFWGDHGTVVIPVADIKPDIDSNNLDALGITTKLAVGDSNFVGSSDDRATNIGVGVGLLNGTLIPPHGTFSFNHAIGEITAEKGYVEGGVIDGQRIGRDIGGGICQVSTTVFRAALKAGLPITEWYPHTYRLAFYEQDGWEPGFDASILQPDGNPFGGGDFKFTNPTDSWMLVEAYTTDDQRVYVIIYGAETGYKVTLSDSRVSDPINPSEHDLEIVDDNLDPGTIEQTEAAQPGYNVSFDRTVTDKDGNVIIQETYNTDFASRPNVYKVSPDMQGKSPASSD